MDSLVFPVADVAAFGFDPANNGLFTTTEYFSGYWPGARGILILGDDSYTTVQDYSRTYGSIAVWTDPQSGYIHAGDVVNGEIGATIVYTGASGNPAGPICLDRETENFWVALANGTIALMNINLISREGLATTVVSSFPYPSAAGGVIDDILFDGAYLWAISVAENIYFQFTPSGTVVTSFYIQSDSSDAMALTSDSRLHFDGSFVYITSLLRNASNSAVMKINPGTGIPSEFFTFPVFSTRGLAFHGHEMFVSTAPTINLSNSP